MSQKIISAIDIRADKIICIIAQELQILDKGKILQLIGIGISKMPIECIKPLSLDKENISNYLRNAIITAETEAGTKINNVYVSLSENMKSEHIEYDVSVKNKIIDESHIKCFYDSLTFKGLYTNTNEPLHSIPISFKLDNKKSVSDPIGLRANKLSIRWHIISTSKNYLEKIYELFNELEVNLKQVVSSHYSSSLAVLTDEESDSGAVTIDIQKNKTVISYTFDNQLIGYDTIKVGTYNFTNDISQIKSIPLDESEVIRKQIDVINSERIKEKKLEKYYEIYASRAEELSNILKNTIQKSKFNSLVANKIVLTGYGAKSLIIQKFINQAIKGANIRIGSTKKINGSKTYLDNPSLASSFGLLSYATNHSLEGDEDDKKIIKKSIFSYIYSFIKNL